MYHLAVKASIEERMVGLRAELAGSGNATALSVAGTTGVASGSGGGAAVAAAGGARVAAGDTNAASTERLTTAQLLRLLDPADSKI